MLPKVSVPVQAIIPLDICEMDEGGCKAVLTVGEDTIIIQFITHIQTN